MRSIEDIITDTQKTTEALLREAFEAGRTHAASDLKSRMSAFFDGLVKPVETHDAPVEQPVQTLEDHSHPDHQQY